MTQFEGQARQTVNALDTMMAKAFQRAYLAGLEAFCKDRGVTTENASRVTLEQNFDHTETTILFDKVPIGKVKVTGIHDSVNINFTILGEVRASI